MTENWLQNEAVAHLQQTLDEVAQRTRNWKIKVNEQNQSTFWTEYVYAEM